MSDPLKSADIEDVLSSIRRLVSEESRDVPLRRSEAEPDKLLLTPALRVPSNDQQDEAGNMAAEPEMPEAAPPEEQAAQDAETPDAAPQADTADAAQSSVTDAQDLIDAFVAGEEYRADDQGHQDEPEASQADDAAELLEWEDHAQGNEGDRAEEWAGTLYDAARAHGEEPPVTDTASAPEMTAPQDDPQTEEPAADHAAAQGSARESDAQNDEVFDFLAGDDAVLDEEALRELVADIVRQELQGALGERITRNVRKLVRREIHRALSAQELD
ncbi:hypothetical protein M8756_09205 [Lutimaribacter sp. EGI FJ00015]|uniref:Uncharacterized protein n=1 Tax=Lutimaribacter degradans TaxID=2945989 RepID=A0ACC5ZXQ1_9RHOB|nr:hypothetical protein [Lutimaribacter sp. EGI FJ00013]MCM2562329.1 hypothetical protein [Lutimaribacter sp. EGI FJ00013]MCO0613484.1 hypothetical protein [Lutimaribacter sp. EGI FJ00015]MCO0636458.1 hypothetical protein [Lutimaribacter sp. EGI FJ00014]